MNEQRDFMVVPETLKEVANVMSEGTKWVEENMKKGDTYVVEDLRDYNRRHLIYRFKIRRKGGV